MIPKSDDPFTITSPGKADGSGLLPAADQQRLEAAFETVLQKGQQTIDKLEQEIAKLEQDIAKKKQEADNLVAQIASRESSLRDDYNRNLLICAFFPNPATCIFANYLANDGTLRSYQQQLDAARAAQAQMQQQLTAYQAKRNDLRARITEIRTGKDRLIAMLHDNQTPSIPPELASSPDAGRAYWRATAMGQVQRAINDEIHLLVDLRNAAVELSNTLDQSLATLRSLDQATQELVEQSHNQFMKLVKALLSGDPAAAADKWLEDQLASRTRALLNSLEWPLNEFARYVVESDTNPNAGDQLVQRILQKLMNGGGGGGLQPVSFEASTQVNVLDNTVAKSAMSVTESRTLSELEVFVDIQHTYVGDLVVSLQHGSQTYVLQNRSGGGQDNLVKTFAVPQAAGQQLKGTWTLVVEDTADQDTGKLRRWQLIAQ
ncbi:MAG TPA: proprotein convertase P-domain-containing protein [Kofleriaceae bacterium]|nr:proprotein convertase P-domain-containing protein [Kofleriaceae bacterium]